MMQDYEYEDRDGDILKIFIDREDDYGLCLSVQVKSEGGEEHVVIVDPLDAPRIARALLERAGHRAGGSSYADAAVGKLKKHEEVVSRQREEDEKVIKYFKEVRQQNLQTVLDWHREEFKRVEKFNKEVFGSRPRIIKYDNAVTVDKSSKWRTQPLNRITYIFKHENGNWHSQTNHDAKDHWRVYGQSLLTLGASYFPLEEVLD